MSDSKLMLSFSFDSFVSCSTTFDTSTGTLLPRRPPGLFFSVKEKRWLGWKLAVELAAGFLWVGDAKAGGGGGPDEDAPPTGGGARKGGGVALGEVAPAGTGGGPPADA